MHKYSYKLPAEGYGKSELKAAENNHNNDAKKLADLVRLQDRHIARQRKEKSRMCSVRPSHTTIGKLLRDC